MASISTNFAKFFLVDKGTEKILSPKANYPRSNLLIEVRRQLVELELLSVKPKNVEYVYNHKSIYG